MIVFDGNIYLDKEHIELLKTEPGYVKNRYFAVTKAQLPPPFHIVYETACGLIDVGLRQFYRIKARFLTEGITGLRKKSTRPKTSPNITPRDEETQILNVRKESGFGPNDIAALVNESNKRSGKEKTSWPSTVYNILVRRGEIERERHIQTEWKHFEWGHPNRLIQADLTTFNGINILTMEDDHARKGWALALKSARDKKVVAGMKKLVQILYDNLLTDNGSQFSRKNAVMRTYCQDYINESHIWSSIHHPQTLGKLSAYQKGLKRFLRHKVGDSQDIDLINYWIGVYNHWYNNGRYHSVIDTYPEVRYSGKREGNWYANIVKALKLENVLTI